MIKHSHARGDRRSREQKAITILEILEKRLGSLRTQDVLDIGTGTGYIASHLKQHARSVTSVDVVDERRSYDFDFQIVTSEMLPFADQMFDAIVSNHVIEHVDDAQLHLAEIVRVMRPGGLCYLATPNRYALLEPHYRLPFLSWLPKSARDSYVRTARRGDRYDVHPLSWHELCNVACAAGLQIEDHSTVLASERVRSRLRVAPSAIGRLHPLFPSFVTTLARAAA